MIKVTKKNGDVHYLNESAFIQIKYCKESDTLVAYPIDSQIPEIKLDGIRKASNINISEVVGRKEKEDYYKSSVKEILSWIYWNDDVRIHKLWGRLMSSFDRSNITTVGELLDFGQIKFSETKYTGPQCVDAVTEALKNLYGIENW
jgi:hypothetical protein